MSNAPAHLAEIQPGSLLDEAFLTAQGVGSHESLAAFAVYCMSNGASSTPDDCWQGTATFIGPQVVDLADIRRTVGVGPKTEINEDTNDFYGNVSCIESRIKKGFQPPPLIVERREDDWLYLLDGNHTKFTLQRRFKLPQYYAIEVLRAPSAVSSEV